MQILRGPRGGERGSTLRELCYRTYPTAMAWETWNYRSRVGRKRPVLVYQVGKVGSCSVVQSLRAARSGLAPLHVHYLTPEPLREAERLAPAIFREKRRIPRHLLDSRYIRRQLESGGLGSRPAIITLVRDPVARAISHFFQRLHLTDADFPLAERLRVDEPPEIARALEPRFHARAGELIREPEAWFQAELKGVFGIDVLSLPFPKTAGYAVHRLDAADLLVVKLERLDECAGEAMREFLGLEAFTLHSANESRERPYYPVYRAFRKQVALSEALLDEAYGLPHVRHFYSETEIEALRAPWLARVEGIHPARRNPREPAADAGAADVTGSIPR